MKKNRIPDNYTSNSAPVLPCRFEIGADGEMILQYKPFPPVNPRALDYVPAMHGKDKEGEYIRTNSYELRIAPSGKFAK